MYLKGLTLKGFKSFASATTLRFEPGITCVVGPNGSGKSNVVDALTWVMGEQGAKALRATKPADPARPVMVAGDPERRTAAQRMKTGIPVGPGLLEKVRQVALASGAPWIMTN